MAFGVGSTLITRVLYAASGAPTMAGAYATAALNLGAAAGPVIGAAALSAVSLATAPIWVAAASTAAALVLALLARTAIREEARADPDDGSADGENCGA